VVDLVDEWPQRFPTSPRHFLDVARLNLDRSSCRPVRRWHSRLQWAVPRPVGPLLLLRCGVPFHGTEQHADAPVTDGQHSGFSRAFFDVSCVAATDDGPFSSRRKDVFGGEISDHLTLLLLFSCACGHGELAIKERPQQHAQENIPAISIRK